MKTSFSKSNIVQILLLIVVVLLAVNIVLEKYYHSVPPNNQKMLSAAVINKRFLNSLKSYNMDSVWISRKSTSPGDEDSLKFNYKVEVPPDLPVTLLLKEIQNQFDTNEVNISATEFKSDKSTLLKVSSGGFLKLKASFKYNSSIFRNTDTIGFALTGIEDLNGDNLKNLLLLPEHFAGILTPSRHSQELLKILTANQKEAAVLLNDDISELEFRLRTGYSQRRIKNSVISIIRKFYNAAFFIIDQNSDIYNSDHYKMIKYEFSKRHITLVDEDKFVTLRNVTPDEIIKTVETDRDRKTLFIISADDFLEMPPLLAGLRKTGYKFFYPSQLFKQ